LARIAGIDVPNNKKCDISLSYIFGVGRSLGRSICEKANVDWNRKMSELSEEELDRIRRIIDNEAEVEGNLRSKVRMNVKRLMDIGCYRGIRHRRGLPVRGQRTRTNSRTRKGPRKTIAGKKKTPSKG
jgi:small subunit ribosomal protein S13